MTLVILHLAPLQHDREGAQKELPQESSCSGGGQLKYLYRRPAVIKDTLIAGTLWGGPYSSILTFLHSSLFQQQLRNECKRNVRRM